MLRIVILDHVTLSLTGEGSCETVARLVCRLRRCGYLVRVDTLTGPNGPCHVVGSREDVAAFVLRLRLGQSGLNVAYGGAALSVPFTDLLADPGPQVVVDDLPGPHPRRTPRP